MHDAWCRTVGISIASSKHSSDLVSAKGEFFFPPTQKGTDYYCCSYRSVLLNCSRVDPMEIWHGGGRSVLGILWISIMLTIDMDYFLGCHTPVLHLFTCAAGCFFRVGGVVIAAFSHYAGGHHTAKCRADLWCGLLGLGAVAAVFAFLGGPYHDARYHGESKHN